MNLWDIDFFTHYYLQKFKMSVQVISNPVQMSLRIDFPNFFNRRSKNHSCLSLSLKTRQKCSFINPAVSEWTLNLTNCSSFDQQDLATSRYVIKYSPCDFHFWVPSVVYKLVETKALFIGADKPSVWPKSSTSEFTINQTTHPAPSGLATTPAASRRRVINETVRR